MRGEGEGVIRRFKGTVSNTVDRACQVQAPGGGGGEKREQDVVVHSEFSMFC